MLCLLLAATLHAKNQQKHLYNRIGVCTSLEKAPMVKAAGGAYVETGISSFCIPERSAEEFASHLEKVHQCCLPVSSANGFFPGDIKLVGPDADHDRVLHYTETAMQRAAEVGITKAVLGSGNARKVPEGFSFEEARQQFINLCKQLAPIAQKYGVTIVLEPLQSEETNFINTVAEGLEIVKAVGHPNFCILADLFHMAREKESPESIVKAGKLLRHVHIAEVAQRTPPGTNGDDFTPYLLALKKIKYKGNISIECGWKNFDQQVGPAIAELQQQIRLAWGKSKSSKHTSTH